MSIPTVDPEIVRGIERVAENGIVHKMDLGKLDDVVFWNGGFAVVSVSEKLVVLLVLPALHDLLHLPPVFVVRQLLQAGWQNHRPVLPPSPHPLYKRFAFLFYVHDNVDIQFEEMRHEHEIVIVSSALGRPAAAADVNQ